MEQYDPDCYACAGPGSVTSILQSIKSEKYVADMKPEFYWGFKVFPSDDFFPIHSSNTTEYFDETMIEKTMEKIKNSIAIHMYSSASSKFKVDKSKQSAYRTLAEANCPQVFAASDNIF